MGRQQWGRWGLPESENLLSPENDLRILKVELGFSYIICLALKKSTMLPYRFYVTLAHHS